MKAHITLKHKTRPKVKTQEKLNFSLHAFEKVNDKTKSFFSNRIKFSSSRIIFKCNILLNDDCHVNYAQIANVQIIVLQ